MNPAEQASDIRDIQGLVAIPYPWLRPLLIAIGVLAAVALGVWLWRSWQRRATHRIFRGASSYERNRRSFVVR